MRTMWEYGDSMWSHHVLFTKMDTGHIRNLKTERPSREIDLGKNKDKFSFQFSSVDQSCPTLCDPMNRSTPGLPVHHQLPEFTQTQVHRVGDSIQPSHPLSSPSPPAPNPSQHQEVKYSDGNQGKETDLECFSGLNLISKAMRINVSLEKEHRQKT